MPIFISQVAWHDSAKARGCVKGRHKVEGRRRGLAFFDRVRRDVEDRSEPAKKRDRQSYAEENISALLQDREIRLLGVFRGGTSRWLRLLISGLGGGSGWRRFDDGQACKSQQRNQSKSNGTHGPSKAHIVLHQKLLEHNRPDHAADRRPSNGQAHSKTSAMRHVSHDHAQGRTEHE